MRLYPPEPRRPGPRHRLRLRGHDPAARRRWSAPEGQAVGVDVAEPFIEASIEEAGEAGVENVEFFAATFRSGTCGGPYDYAFSRMGVMFFANPVQAFRNIRERTATRRPAGRRRLAAKARQRVASPRRAGGRAVPRGAGGARGRALWSRPVLDGQRRHRHRAARRSPDSSGRPSRAAICRSRSATTSTTRSPSTWRIGPAAELLRICPADEVDRLRPKSQQEIREVLADYVQARRRGRGPRLHLDHHAPRPLPARRCRTTLRRDGRDTSKGGNLRAPRRDPGAAEAALGLPLTRMR